jgi:hypothetical protein
MSKKGRCSSSRPTVYARDAAHAEELKKQYGRMSVDIVINAGIYQQAEQIPEYRRFKGIE